MIVVLIIVGGGLGAVARWLLTVWLGTSKRGFPTGTTTVNVLGSFILGVIFAFDVSVHSFESEPLTIGILGGFTTFSTWMVEVDAAGDQQIRATVMWVPTVLGVSAAALGLTLGRAIAG